MRVCQRSCLSFTHLCKRSPSHLWVSSAQRRPLSKPNLPNPARSIRFLNLKAFENKESTIYALSTAPGRAAIAIIRVSGPAWLTVYQALCPGKEPPKPRYATLRTLYEAGKPPDEADVLDSGVLIFHFPAPMTATGEDVLEFHIHGGTAVVQAVLAAISKSCPQHGAQSIRYAEPGEFTRRAFYNNRLDLTQIEALGDTLAADTEQQRRLAVRGNTSDKSNLYESWRQKLLYARGELEALIDFSEDQHFDESPAQQCASVRAQVQELKLQLHEKIVNAKRGELIRNGINIALVGAPNAGKSSLLNRIVGREAAIVSSEAGTTRDVIDVNVDIGGYFCKFGDLAGLRSKSRSPNGLAIGEIEKEGMRRAKQRALTADVVVVVLSVVATNGPNGPEVSVDFSHETKSVLVECGFNKQEIIFVLNKADLITNDVQLNDQCRKISQHPILVACMGYSKTQLYPISCKNEDGSKILRQNSPNAGGIQPFLDGLVQLFGKMTSAIPPWGQEETANNSNWAESLGANERQRTLLEQCLDHLETFLVQVDLRDAYGRDTEDSGKEIDIVLAAESLRAAANCLAKITGKGEAGDVEEVLGVVFEKFCVGK